MKQSDCSFIACYPVESTKVHSTNQALPSIVTAQKQDGACYHPL